MKELFAIIALVFVTLTINAQTTFKKTFSNYDYQYVLEVAHIIDCTIQRKTHVIMQKVI